jgi:hypothetical protein
MVKNPYRFYTYAYLREDRTPYYIGKGTGDRIKDKRRTIKPPKDKSRIILLKQNLTEEEAFRHEKYMIAVFGRKDLGTGILYNRTDGGEGTSNIIRDENWKKNQKLSQENRFKDIEQRKKMSDSIKKWWDTPGVKNKLISSFKNKKLSKEHKYNLSESMKNFYERNPDYKKQKSEYQSNFLRGKKWWNDGQNEKMRLECPGDGWARGRLPRKNIEKE